MDRKQLEIEEPCPMAWDGMDGTDQRRHCAECRRDVHDLSAMTAADAAALMNDGVHRCIRYAVDAEGRVLHRPPPKRSSPWGRRLAVVVAGVGLVVGAPAVASSQASPELAERLVERVQGWIDWWFGEEEEATPAPAEFESIEVELVTLPRTKNLRVRRLMGIPRPPKPLCQPVDIVESGKKKTIRVDTSGNRCE